MDSGYTISLIDQHFLKPNLPDAEIRTHQRPRTVRPVVSTSSLLPKSVVIPLYVKGIPPDGTRALALMAREFQVIDKLERKALIGFDIAGPELFRVDHGERVVSIGAGRARHHIALEAISRVLGFRNLHCSQAYRFKATVKTLKTTHPHIAGFGGLVHLQSPHSVGTTALMANALEYACHNRRDEGGSVFASLTAECACRDSESCSTAGTPQRCSGPAEAVGAGHGLQRG